MAEYQPYLLQYKVQYRHCTTVLTVTSIEDPKTAVNSGTVHSHVVFDEISLAAHFQTEDPGLTTMMISDKRPVLALLLFTCFAGAQERYLRATVSFPSPVLLTRELITM